MTKNKDYCISFIPAPFRAGVDSILETQQIFLNLSIDKAKKIKKLIRKYQSKDSGLQICIEEFEPLKKSKKDGTDYY